MTRAPWESDALATVAALHATAEEHGCPDPSPEAVALAERVVRALAAHRYLPEPHITPGADPGVGITVRRGGLTVYVEAHNEGDDGAACVVFCVSDGKGWPAATEVEPDGFADAADASARFLLEGTPVPWKGATE